MAVSDEELPGPPDLLMDDPMNGFERGAEKATGNPPEGEEKERMQGNPLFVQKAGFPRTPSGKNSKWLAVSRGADTEIRGFIAARCDGQAQAGEDLQERSTDTT